jgi:hypothetical protein
MRSTEFLRNTLCTNDCSLYYYTYEGVSKSFRTGRLERELQMVQLSATRCSYIAILSVSLVSVATAITLCVATQRVFIIVSVYFVIDSVRKPSYKTNLMEQSYSWKPEQQRFY